MSVQAQLDPPRRVAAQLEKQWAEVVVVNVKVVMVHVDGLVPAELKLPGDLLSAERLRLFLRGPDVPERFAGGAGLPDDMCLGEDGNLYVAHLGCRQVVVFDKRGRVIRILPAGNRRTTNVAFGGPGRDQLYITSAAGPPTGGEPLSLGFEYHGSAGAADPASAGQEPMARIALMEPLR
jgi:hypothetical protein